MSKRIEIVAHEQAFQVNIIDDRSIVVRRFTYLKVEAARTAAQAWSSGHENCPVKDLTVARTK